MSLKVGGVLAVSLLAVAGCGPNDEARHFLVRVEQQSIIGKPISETVEDRAAGTCFVGNRSATASQQLDGLGNFTAEYTGQSISCSVSASNQLNRLVLTLSSGGHTVATSNAGPGAIATVADR